jgi:hypothetical protein
MDVIHYWRLVLWTAFQHSVSLAQAVIFLIFVTIGGVVWLLPIFGMTANLSALLNIITAPQFYATLFGSVVIMRLICAPYWVWKDEKDTRIKAEKQLAETLNQNNIILPPPQEQLLTLLADYQRRFSAHKLIIGRRNGKLHFDGDPRRDEGISLIQDLFGHVGPTNAARFEELMERMPPEYLRFYPETRMDSPFVVSVTEIGLRYLKTSAPEPTKQS